uniref:polynucleotide adenylyltransferase n=1 Tax=Globodera pallida TaxID=36090 RepID=A0A183BW87_GLOPA
MELLTNSLTYAEPKKVAQIKGQLSMYERFNKMLENDRQFAHSQRESVKDLVAMLKAFANFGKHLKILELISDKNDTIISGNLLHRFGITLAYLELWTKANYLNDGKMGYLDIEMLSIMRSVNGKKTKTDKLIEAEWKGNLHKSIGTWIATEFVKSVEPIPGDEQKEEVEANDAEGADDDVEAVFGVTDSSPSPQKELTPTKSVSSSETGLSGERDEHESVNAIVHLVGVGVYANEIWHRLKAIHLMDGICYEIGIEKSAVIKIEREWAQLKELKLTAKSQWTELEKHLHRLLQQLLGLMDKTPFSADGGDAGEEICEIKNELHLRNLALLLADGSNASQMFWGQTNSMIALLFTQKGADFYCDNEREKCRGQSLYCKLCNNANVLTLRKIKKDQFYSISQLQFSFKSVQITILAIIVPGLSHFGPDEPFNGQQIDKISKKFGCEIENLIRADHFFDEGQFRSSQFLNNQTMELLTNSLTYAEPKKVAQINGQLSMYERFNKMLENDRQFAHSQRESVKDLVAMLKAFANFGKHLKILELISDKNDTIISGNLLHRFGITLAYLELWTKANYLDDGKMGYLDIEMLSIMVAKTFLLYPNASVPLLIERFFVTYSAWKWPLPIQLAKVDFDREGEFLSWTPGREWFTKRQSSPKTLLKLIKAELIMAIVTPTFPEQNLAQNANLSALKCLQNHMIKALAKIRNDAAQNALIGLLESKKFTNMRFNTKLRISVILLENALGMNLLKLFKIRWKNGLNFAMCLLTTGSLSGKAMRRIRNPRRLIARKFG